MANPLTLTQKLQAIIIQMNTPGNTVDERKNILVNWVQSLPGPERSMMIIHMNNVMTQNQIANN